MSHSSSSPAHRLTAAVAFTVVALAVGADAPPAVAADAVAAIPADAAASTSASTVRSVTTESGRTVSIIVGGPDDATGGIVLVHDWFGVTPFYHEAVTRLAREGYRVVAVDLYDGRSATTHPEAWELMSALDTTAAASAIDAAIGALANRPLALIGFSMGAPHAIRASMRHAQRVRATVVFYGDTPSDPATLAELGGPILSIQGSRDGEAASAAAALSVAADEAAVGAEIYVYPGAHHAFAQPLFNGGETYDPAAARAAWRLAVDFLDRRLRGESG
jgi:carboxymethylenebutenolidase